MNDVIGNALLLSDEEFTVLVCVKENTSFFGYDLSERSLDIERRFMGINSLVRRKILYKTNEEYHISAEYQMLIKAVNNARNCFVISEGDGIVYCAQGYTLVRRIEADPVRYSLAQVTAESLAQTLIDEAYLPENDEYEFMTCEIETKDQLEQVLRESGNEYFSVSQYGSENRIVVVRLGLCMTCVLMHENRVEARPFSKHGFTEMLKELFEGEKNDNN